MRIYSTDVNVQLLSELSRREEKLQRAHEFSGATPRLWSPATLEEGC